MNRFIADALREAKKGLWDGRHPGNRNETFICLALGDVKRRAQIDVEERWVWVNPSACSRAAPMVHGAELAIAVIEDRIWPCLTLDEWVWENVEGYKGSDKQITWETMQVYRHRWLDALIVEFSA